MTFFHSMGEFYISVQNGRVFTPRGCFRRKILCLENINSAGVSSPKWGYNFCSDEDVRAKE